MPKNYENPEFMKKWKDNEGWLGDPDKKEKALEAQRKGGAVSAARKKARAAARRLLEDKQEFILQAATQVTADNPEWMQKMISMFITIMQDESADPKDRMNAADKLTSIIGTQAPKQTESKIKMEETDIEEDVEKLKNLGVNVEGFKIVK